jgi:uncharacterized protein YecE (DUF72 family)
MPIFLGCAGWSLDRRFAAEFPGDGTHLERYALRLNAVEINSSFYRPHQRKTYARWAESTPADFRFAVKAPKRVTHVCRLVGCEAELARFADEVQGLGDKLGPILVQLPPSLGFDPATAARFFAHLRQLVATPVVCEPRHRAWFTPAAERLLEEWNIARVAADPALVPAAANPGGWPGLRYFRLHGSPHIYYSSYDEAFRTALAARLTALNSADSNIWCIFDNTAQGAAIENGLDVDAKVRSVR